MYFQKNHSCSLLSSVSGGKGISTLTQINEDHKKKLEFNNHINYESFVFIQSSESNVTISNCELKCTHRSSFYLPSYIYVFSKKKKK